MEKSRVKAHLNIADEIGLKLADGGPGVTITDVARDSLAANAGITPGDSLVSLQFQPLSSSDEFQAEVRTLLSKGRSSILLLVSGQKGRRWVALKLQ